MSCCHGESQQPSCPAAMAKLTIGYWKIRGLGAPLRMMCSYAGADFESIDYEHTGGPGAWDCSSWFDVKPEFQAQNSMINLPYLKDGDRLITQSNACLYYLGRKFGLDNRSEDAAFVNDQVVCQCYDLRNDTVAHAYGGRPEDSQAFLSEKVAVHFAKLEGFLSNEAPYFCGNEPCSGDFHVFEMIDQARRLATERDLKSPLPGCSKLQRLYETMLSEPRLAGYFASEMHKFPINGPMAQFK